MKLKFVYWFAFYNINSPTVRYRGRFPLDFLKENYDINSYMILPSYRPATIFLFIKAYFSALLFPKKNSLIVIQSVYTKSVYATALKLLVKIRKKNVFYDLDDADYLRYSPETIYYFLKNCSAVTLGSSELVKNLSKHNKNSILITCPTKDLKIVKHRKNDILTIGWIGDFTKGHKESLLNVFFPALIDLPFKVKLILMGVDRTEEYEFLNEYFKSFKNVTVEIPQNIDWMNEIAIQKKIASFDVGVATLLDNEFSRSKSAFKLKQCFNNGIPVLSSNISENNVFIDHGKNGYLCDTSAEFQQRIIEFNEMKEDDYKVFSENARKAIHLFNLTNFCDTLIRTYEKNSI